MLTVRGKAALVLASQATAAVIAYGSLLVIGRLFDPASYGMVAFALGVTNLLALLTDFGVSLAYQREVARGADVRTAFGVMLRLRAVLGAGTLLLAVAAWPLLKPVVAPQVADATTWEVVGVVAAFQLLAIARLMLEATWMAQQRVHLTEGLRIIDAVTVLVLLANAGLLLAALNGWTPPFVAVGAWWADALRLEGPIDAASAALLIAGSYLVAKVVALGVGLARAWRDGLRASGWDRGLARTFLHASLPLALAYSLAVVVSSNDSVFLGYFWGAPEVARYSAAQRLASIALLAGTSVAALLFPRYAELHALGDKEGQDATFQAAQRYLVLIAAPMVAAMLALPSQGIGVTLGPAYAGAITPLRWLAGWALLVTLSQPVNARLMAEGHNRVLVVAVALNAGSDVLLNLAFVPRWGPAGAAATTFASAALGFVYLRLWSRRAHGTPLWQPGVARTLVAAALVGLGWWALGHALPSHRLDHAWELLAAGIVGLAVYGALLAALRELTAEDARILARLLHPRAWLPRKDATPKDDAGQP